MTKSIPQGMRSFSRSFRRTESLVGKKLSFFAPVTGIELLFADPSWMDVCISGSMTGRRDNLGLDFGKT